MSASFNAYDDAYASRHRREVIEMARQKVQADQLAGPVRLEFLRLPTDDTFVGITPIGTSGKMWLVAPKPGTRRTGNVKVERMADGAWTCSHKGWKPKEDCIHILRVRHMLGEDGVVPYDGRRRRPLTAMLYTEGPAEDTRRRKARAAEPTRVPQLAAELCAEYTEAPAREETHPANRGANGAPYAARAYALLMKVFANLSYEQLGERMSAEPTMCEVLGYAKVQPPSKNTFIRWFGDPLLTIVLRDLFVATTTFTKRFDTMVLGDSHDIPTRMVDNSRDRKFGPQPAPYRNPSRELVRQHFTVGKVSNIIYAADTTLRTGTGTNDGIHLRSLLQQTRERSETIAAAAFDKAYDGKENFAEAARLKMNLFVREKQGENRLDESWPEMARRQTELERKEPIEYAEAYRFRSKVEGTPSRIKARNPYIRLRRRKRDPVAAVADGATDKTSFSDLPSEVQDAMLATATLSVGIARLNESIAILIVANLRSLNMMEWLYDQRVFFDKTNPIVLNPPREMSERDVNGVA